MRERASKCTAAITVDAHKHKRTPPAHAQGSTVTRYCGVCHNPYVPSGSPHAAGSGSRTSRSKHISQGTRRWVTRNIIKGRARAKEPANTLQTSLHTRKHPTLIHAEPRSCVGLNPHLLPGSPHAAGIGSRTSRSKHIEQDTRRWVTRNIIKGLRVREIANKCNQQTSL